MLLASLLVGATVVACSGGSGSTPAGPGGGVSGDGVFSVVSTDQSSATSGSKVVVVWTVSSGSPDYLYSVGNGAISGSQVSVTFGSDPPAEALNRGILGIGLIALVDENLAVSGGKVALDEKALRAVSADHAIIFRASDAPYTRSGWDTTFPKGFACAKCVPKEPNSSTPFDSFAVEDCSKVILKPAGSRICNWT
jgi:hypothetical protein